MLGSRRERFEELERALEGRSHAIGATELEVRVADEPVGTCGAPWSAGGLELTGGSLGLVPRLLESPVRLRRLGQLQEREAVLLRAR